MPSSFDAVLLIAFGGPQGRDDIRPFLANVLRGRRVAPERVEEVAHHYELFDGVSPITELTNRQARALQEALAAAGSPLPVYVGMRNWDPYLQDTLAQMARDGVRRAVGVIAAAHRSYSSCLQYRENVAAAQRAVREQGLPVVEVTYVDDWHLAPGFIDANARNIVAALHTLPEEVRADAQVVFTAHSIPVAMAERYPYQRQLEETCAAVAAQVSGAAWRLVFQSRSGRPEDPWLGPDICDYLAQATAAGVPGVVVCPVGFVCDHVEVLYDLDMEAAQAARELGLPFARAAAVNDDAQFVGAVADAVLDTTRRYAGGRPLPLIPGNA